MRRLTLILSDLYLPEEAAGSASSPPPVDLPGLDWLLRFAERPRRIDDWRTWLAGQLGKTRFARLPVALACEMKLRNRGIGDAWLATPVHLEARLDHVRLVDRGVLRIEAHQRAAWCEEFAQIFGPQYALHDIGERTFLLTGITPTAAQTRDPVRVLGSDIAPSLPRGPEAAELRRLGAEIEMWLHRAALNARRERARELRVSALWLWGGGLPPGDIPAESIAATSEVRIHGDDPFLCALAESPAPTPPSFGKIAPDAGHAVVELTPMTGPPEQSLHSLEANWFAPVRAALTNGALEACDIVANDLWLSTNARPGWKFWRRRSSWLARLGSETGGA